MLQWSEGAVLFQEHFNFTQLQSICICNNIRVLTVRNPVPFTTNNVFERRIDFQDLAGVKITQINRDRGKFKECPEFLFA